MPILFWILVSTFLISLISLVGVLALLLKERLLNKVLMVLVAFSAGNFIYIAVSDLLPEIKQKVSWLYFIIIVVFDIDD